MSPDERDMNVPADGTSGTVRLGESVRYCVGLRSFQYSGGAAALGAVERRGWVETWIETWMRASIKCLRVFVLFGGGQQQEHGRETLFPARENAIIK